MRTPKIGVYYIKNGKPVKKYTESVNKDILLVIGQYCQFYLHVKTLGIEDFDTAQKKAAELGEGWGCPDKYQGLTIADNSAEIREKTKNLGADLNNVSWFWTCNKKEYGFNNTLYENMNFGYCSYRSKYNQYHVLAVSAFRP